MAKVLALLAAVAVGGVATASAGSNGAQLTVGVTVTRSCAVDARPADASYSVLRLNCAAGATPGVRLSDSGQRPADASAALGLRVPTVPFSETPTGSLHVVTLNF